MLTIFQDMTFNIMPVWLGNACSHPIWGSFGGKNRGNGKLLAVLSL